MSAPYFSLVMPVKDREQLVGPAIASVLAQSFSDWEFIIVNDHSEDNTLAVLRSFVDARIKIFDAPREIRGIARARHFGNQQASGEVIVVVDSDDINYPDRLAVTREHFENDPALAVFYGNIDLFKDAAGETEPRWFQPFVKELLYYFDYIPNPASAYRRLAYERVAGYDPSLVVASDWDLWLQFADKDLKFDYSEKSLVKYRLHKKSITAEKAELHNEHKRRIQKKHGLRPDSSPENVIPLFVPEIQAILKKQ